MRHTDLDIGALIVGNAGIGRAWRRVLPGVVKSCIVVCRKPSTYQDQCRWLLRRLRQTWWLSTRRSMDKVKGKSGVGRKVEVGGGEVIRKKIRSGVKVGAGQNLEAKKKKGEPTFTLSLFLFFFFLFFSKCISAGHQNHGWSSLRLDKPPLIYRTTWVEEPWLTVSDKSLWKYLLLYGVGAQSTEYSTVYRYFHRLLLPSLYLSIGYQVECSMRLYEHYRDCK